WEPDAGARGEHDRRLDPFAPDGVVHAVDDRVDHVRVGEERVLHLGRPDVLAAGDDRLLRAAHQVQPAVVVEPADVAGPDAALDQHVRRLIRAAPVALHLPRAPDDDLALRAGRQPLAAGSPDLDARPRHRPAHAAGLGADLVALD